MTGLLLAVLLASLLGSLHCAGMCGGVVALCVDGRPAASARRGTWAPLAAYHGGRLVTYAALGLASGALGAAVDLGGAAAGLSRAAAVVAGGLMIAFGAAVLLRAAGGAARLRHPRLDADAVRRGAAVARSLPPARRAAILGLLTGALPCGWLYAFVITAAGTGHPLRGGLVMVAFWAGTVPVLATLGLGLDRLAVPLRRRLPVITAAALLLVGVATVGLRLGAPAYGDSIEALVPATADAAAVRGLDSGAMPCCHDGPR